VLMGTARYVQEQRDEAERAARAQEVERLKTETRVMRQKLQLQIEAMRIEMAEKESALKDKLLAEATLKTSVKATKNGILRRRSGTGRE